MLSCTSCMLASMSAKVSSDTGVWRSARRSASSCCRALSCIMRPRMASLSFSKPEAAASAAS